MKKSNINQRSILKVWTAAVKDMNRKSKLINLANVSITAISRLLMVFTEVSEEKGTCVYD